MRKIREEHERKIQEEERKLTYWFWVSPKFSGTRRPVTVWSTMPIF
jgi:hypothetical protein